MVRLPWYCKLIIFIQDSKSENLRNEEDNGLEDDEQSEESNQLCTSENSRTQLENILSNCILNQSSKRVT